MAKKRSSLNGRKGKRSTNVQMAVIIDKAIELIRANKSYSTQIKEIMEFSGKSMGSAKAYLTKAHAKLKDLHEDDIQKIRIQMIDSYWQDLEFCYDQFKVCSKKGTKDFSPHNANRWWDRYQDIKEKIAKYYPAIMEQSDDDLIININIARIKKDE